MRVIAVGLEKKIPAPIQFIIPLTVRFLSLYQPPEIANPSSKTKPRPLSARPMRLWLSVDRWASMNPPAKQIRRHDQCEQDDNSCTPTSVQVEHFEISKDYVEDDRGKASYKAYDGCAYLGSLRSHSSCPWRVGITPPSSRPIIFR